jgi:hypothetical protein
MCIHGGYKVQTVEQLQNVIGAYDARRISLGALRVYLAALVSVASREAAQRSRKKCRRGVGERTPRFLNQELSRTTRLPLKRVTKELKALKRVGLLWFSESEVVFEEAPLDSSSARFSELARGRSSRRPVPLPRPMLRFLARCSRASLIKTTLAYCVRGLTLSRTGDISGRGSVKATTIGRALNLSERSVRSARAELLGLGFLTADEGSIQRKLNRTGAYFTVNLSWVAPVEPKVVAKVGESIPSERSSPVDNFFACNARFAPPRAENIRNFAPPYKDKKTLFRSKNQRTQAERLMPTGLCAAKTKERIPGVLGALPPPNIRDVRAEDLQSFRRVEELYRQAVKVQLIEPSEANVINFIGAAAKATRVKGEAPRIFMGIIRGKLWRNLTSADEDRAVGALRRYRAENPNRFRLAT